MHELISGTPISMLVRLVVAECGAMALIGRLNSSLRCGAAIDAVMTGLGNQRADYIIPEARLFYLSNLTI